MGILQISWHLDVQPTCYGYNLGNWHLSPYNHSYSLLTQLVGHPSKGGVQSGPTVSMCPVEEDHERKSLHTHTHTYSNIF